MIDLNNPILTDEAKEEIDGILSAPLDVTDRSINNLVGIIYEQDLTEFQGDTRFQSFFAPFKRIEEKEHEFYEKEVNN